MFTPNFIYPQTNRPSQRNSINTGIDPPGHMSANISIGEILFLHHKKLFLGDKNYTLQQFNLRVPKIESPAIVLLDFPAKLFQNPGNDFNPQLAGSQNILS